MTNIDFLKNSSFGFLINELQNGINTELIKPLTNYNQQITNLEGDFLKLATKAFGFNVIENFLMNGKKFFQALPTITTFESFLDLVESIFLSREVVVIYLAPAKIALQIVTHNQALLKKYMDTTIVKKPAAINKQSPATKKSKPNTVLSFKQQQEHVIHKEYTDYHPKNYLGFKEQDFLGLEAFFKKFLQPFLPAGVLLDKVTLINPEKRK